MKNIVSLALVFHTAAVQLSASSTVCIAASLSEVSWMWVTVIFEECGRDLRHRRIQAFSQSRHGHLSVLLLLRSETKKIIECPIRLEIQRG